MKGIIPALATILNSDGSIDEEGMRSQVRANLQWGVHGLAVGIIGGEFYKFDDEERKRVWDITIDEANGKVPVLVGTSYAGTLPSVALGRYAKDAGADGVIVMPPYFHRAESTVSLHEHFSIIASKVDLPLMIQDAEDEIGVVIPPMTYSRLAKEHSNITMAKVEGVNALEKIEGIRKLAPNLGVFGGMAGRLLIDELKLGGKGNIPGCCMTDLLVKVYNRYTAGDIPEALKLNEEYHKFTDFFARYPLLMSSLEKETLRLRGIIKSAQVRDPAQRVERAQAIALASLLKEMRVIKKAE